MKSIPCHAAIFLFCLESSLAVPLALAKNYDYDGETRKQLPIICLQDLKNICCIRCGEQRN